MEGRGIEGVGLEIGGVVGIGLGFCGRGEGEKGRGGEGEKGRWGEGEKGRRRRGVDILGNPWRRFCWIEAVYGGFLTGF